MIFEDWTDLTLIEFSQFGPFDDFTVFYREKSQSNTKFFCELYFDWPKPSRYYRRGNNVFSRVCLSFCLFTGRGISMWPHLDMFNLVHLGNPHPHGYQHLFTGKSWWLTFDWKALLFVLILYWLLFITKILDLFPLLAFVFVASLSLVN